MVEFDHFAGGPVVRFCNSRIWTTGCWAGLWSGFVIPVFGPQAIEPSCGQGLQFLFWTTGYCAALWSVAAIPTFRPQATASSCGRVLQFQHLDHRPPRRPVVRAPNSGIYTASGAENRQIADKITDKIKDSTASFLKGKQPNPYFKPGRCSLFGWMLEIASDFFL